MNASEGVLPMLRSIQVGMPQDIEEVDEKGVHIWHTAYIKTTVTGPIWLGATNLKGDGQADKRYHGGPDQALLAYGADHYPLWHDELGINLPYGAFGENFTISGLDENTVCLGDIYDLGEVRIQVSQPRGPCVNIGHRWGIPQLTKLVEKTGRSGWYLRVLREGYVEAGLAVKLIERPYAKWTITHTHDVMRNRNSNPAAALELLDVTALGIRDRQGLLDWQERLAAHH